MPRHKPSNADRARHLPKRGKTYGTAAALRAAVVAHARAELQKLTGVDVATRVMKLREDSPAERRIADAIKALGDAVRELEARAKTKGKGPLATWARNYAGRIAADVRDMRIPWTAPKNGGSTILLELVWRVDLDKRDVLGIRRRMTDREVALLAILRGYYPNHAGSKLESLTVSSVIARACNAVRKARPPEDDEQREAHT